MKPWEQTVDDLADQGKTVAKAEYKFERAHVVHIVQDGNPNLIVRGQWLAPNGEYEWETFEGELLKLFCQAINEELDPILRRVRKKLVDARAAYIKALREQAAWLQRGRHEQPCLPGMEEADWEPIDPNFARKLIHFLGPDAVIWVGHETDVVRAMPDDVECVLRGQCYSRPQYFTAMKTMQTIARDEGGEVIEAADAAEHDAADII